MNPRSIATLFLVISLICMTMLVSCAHQTDPSSSLDGTYTISVETEATTTGMASITYDFVIRGQHATMSMITYHAPILCDGNYILKKVNEIWELKYDGEDAAEYCADQIFHIKTKNGQVFIKGVGSEATYHNWLPLKKVMDEN